MTLDNLGYFTTTFAGCLIGKLLTRLCTPLPTRNKENTLNHGRELGESVTTQSMRGKLP